MTTKYYWIGGSTGSTSASRFEWNVASNWRTVKDVIWGDPAVEVSTEIPGPYDVAIVGGYYNNGSEGGETLVPFTATSPLLFGGFSGDLSNGGWTDSTYGSTGTTYTTSLYSFIVKGKKSKDNFNDLDYSINYPFKIIGGGISAGTISTLKGLSLVSGMNSSNWDYLLTNATSRQKQGLKLKTNDVIIETDASRGITSGTASELSSPANAPIIVELELIDNYGHGTSIKDIQTSVDFNSVNTNVKLVNSKINYINFEQPLLTWGGMTAGSPRNYDRCGLNLSNCIVENISCNSFVALTTDRTCLIGKINIVNTNKEKSILPVNTNLNFKGTFDVVSAAVSLRQFPTLTGVTLPNININFDKNHKPIFVNVGEESGPNGTRGITFDCDFVKITTPATIYLRFYGTANIRTVDLNNSFLQSGYAGSASIKNTIFIRDLYLRGNSRFLVEQYTGTIKDWRIGQVSSNSILGGIITDKLGSINNTNNRLVSNTATMLIADTTNYFIPYSISGNSNNRINQYYSNIEEIRTPE